MKIFEDIQSWVRVRDSLLAENKSIGFVPTMGTLHEGHLSLIEEAKKNHDFVLTSIFVNPTQFNDPNDFEKYPRSLVHDIASLEKTACDALLTPNQNQIYSQGYAFQVHENQLNQILCGARRPGHFTGVQTVVLKLLGIAQASACYMGEKDYQQFLLIQKMAEDFFIKTKIIACPTVREKNGLAMSSRNLRLSTAGYELAAQIYKWLQQDVSCEQVENELKKLGFDVEYVEDHWQRRFVAAWLEGVRLIDNVKR